MDDRRDRGREERREECRKIGEKKREDGEREDDRRKRKGTVQSIEDGKEGQLMARA